MATVVLQYAGSAAGTLLGGPLGGMIGRAAGAIAGNLLDQALFGGGKRRVEGPRLGDVRLMSSTEGSPIPRVFGRMRVSGQVIWATRFEEVTKTSTSSAGSKGGSKVSNVEHEYYANFAVALCEGPIGRVGHIWADGKELDVSGLTWRLHAGDAAQEADSLIIAKEGAGNVPAYRGVAYAVFERMPVADYGNRLPQLSFEVFRPVGGAGGQVRAVNIIPGSTEFGYDPRTVTQVIGRGETVSENVHAVPGRSDWAVSLDALAASCENLEAAALVVSWFGTDLRCGHCQVKPGVEAAVKVTEPEAWRVAGQSRSAAHVVSRHDGVAAFGGTPADATVIRALRDLRARGIKPVFYPFVQMDIPHGNALPDPHGADAQAAYPWRGRITCDPAPGLAGTVDRTALCADQLAYIIGSARPGDFTVSGDDVAYSGPAEWSLRRMVLHYAALCRAAGGVEAFLIGSELRGLTTLRDGAGGFPFVVALESLAADVRVLLPDAKISYAADWSEYFGFHPADGSGDVYFHLDPLWSSPSIDFIGIDNYMPLTDWRDGSRHRDRLDGARSIHDRAYLASRIAGGEGHDWYYASAADRNGQVRTPITDGAYGKPWVFRYKDIRSWWSNPHVERRGGVELAAPTAWVPGSKPVWFTEAGCPAIDKGTNQPNAFADAKSAESARPHYSSGQRDDEIQGRFVSVLHDYWSAAGGHNPISPIYGGPMVDASRIFLWAWDARPFPWFPARSDQWADAANYACGHWLNGRIDAMPLGRLIAGVCESFGIGDADVSGVDGLVDGFLVDRIISARGALEGITNAFAVDAVESGGRIAFRARNGGDVRAIPAQALVEDDPATALFTLTRAQETELPRALKMSYLDTGTDYRRAAVEAFRVSGGSAAEAAFDLPCALSQDAAQARAEILLQERWAGRETVDFGLPPSHAALEPGDIVRLDLDGGARDFRIETVTDGGYRKIRARLHQPSVYERPATPERRPAIAVLQVSGKPDAVMMDLPIAGAGAVPGAPWIAATARPWPGGLALSKYAGNGTAVFNRTIGSRATMGSLLNDLARGPLHVFDRANRPVVQLDHGALASVSEAELLLGANVAAVGSDGEDWELLQFASAELVGADSYRLGGLLRGVSGSEPEMRDLRSAGARFVLLNAAVVQPVLADAEAGLTLRWKFDPLRQPTADNGLVLTHAGRMLGLRPLSPAQLRMRRDGGDLLFSWIRRTRINGDSWEMAEVPLGEEAEKYVFEVLDGVGLRRTIETAAPSCRYTAAEIAADFGALPASLSIRIAQVSATYGRGANLVRTIHV